MRALKVAASDVDAYFQQVDLHIQHTHLGVGAQLQRVVLLHFGVADMAAEYRLESRAYNCADFRVPDERGWCPRMEEIEPGQGLGTWVGSRLPLGIVCEQLAARGHKTVVSEDAGRFVCNWTYYRACRLAERYGLEVVFVHVPPFAGLDETKQRAFLLDIIHIIASCLTQGI